MCRRFVFLKISQQRSFQISNPFHFYLPSHPSSHLMYLRVRRKPINSETDFLFHFITHRSDKYNLFWFKKMIEHNKSILFETLLFTYLTKFNLLIMSLNQSSLNYSNSELVNASLRWKGWGESRLTMAKGLSGVLDMLALLGRCLHNCMHLSKLI